MRKQEFLTKQLDLIKKKQTDSSIEWKDIAEFRGAFLEEKEHDDTVRKGCKILLEYLKSGWDLFPTDSVNLGCLQDSQKIYKERVKLRAERNEFNKWVTGLSRDELIAERIIQAIRSLPAPTDPIPLEYKESPKDYLLVFGDCHYAIEFEIRGLSGEILNSYSPEIFEQRMYQLYDEVVNKIKTNNIHHLTIWELGDSLQGILRLNSQLMQLRYGIIESGIRYAMFLSEWLNRLSQYVTIDFQMVKDSNHNQLRILNAPKNSFPDENMSKVIWAFLEERLKNNPNIKLIDNPTGMTFSELSGYTLLGIHGEVKNLAEALNAFSRSYKQHIDYIIGAHVHHLSVKETGVNSEAISIRSVIGADPYGMSILKTSNAGASLLELEPGKGVTADYRIKLN